jgi:pyruvate/2-oxoglutarate dehydrogenase complex dihydrolipoamide acyltransferase (E2) component
MSGIPPIDEGPEEIDEQYRRASLSDASRPTDGTRRTILAHAAQLAAVREPKARVVNRGWKPALFGSLAAAVFAGLLMTPVFFRPPVPPANLPGNEVSHSYSETSSAPAKPAADIPKVAAAPAEPPDANLPEALGAARSSTPKPPTLNADAAAKATAPAPRIAANEAAHDLVRQEKVAPAEAQSRLAGTIAGLTAGRPDTALAASDSSARTAQAVAPARPPWQPSSGAEATDQGAALRRAAELGDIAALQLLFDQHADLESRDALGRTALMLAALKGQFDSVQALLAHGADPSAADAKGATPLRAALAGNYPAIAAALQRAGGQ